MKYTGKKYVAIDNSYEVNLSNPLATKKYLGGTYNTDFTITTITCEPFIVNYLGSHCNEYNNKTFVMVKDSENITYMTLFYKHGLIDSLHTIDDHIKRHEEFQIHCIEDF